LIIKAQLIKKIISRINIFSKNLKTINFIKKFMSKKHPYIILIILLLALISRLIFVFTVEETLWDSGVYIGMGKYIYSGGEAGLFEHIRPLFVPFVLGGIWKLGFDPVLFGRLFEILLMLGIIWLTCQLANHWFNEKTGVIAAALLAFSPIFYYLSFHQYTEIPAVFFSLLALYLYTKNRPILTGITVALAFYSKFPAGIFIIVLGLMYFSNKQYKQSIKTGVTFGLCLLPYVIWNVIAYGNPFATLIAASNTMKLALGCNVLRAQPWWQYFYWLIFSETKIHLFSIIGLFSLAKQWKKKHILLATSIILPLLYFIQLPCRDYRYITLFLPFVIILTGLGLACTYDLITKKLKNKTKNKLFIVMLFVILFLTAYTSYLFFIKNNQTVNPAEKGYYEYAEQNNITGGIWIANPIIAVHTNAKLEKIYYPIYKAELSLSFYNYIAQNQQNIGAVFLDNCGGGMICPPNDAVCEQQTQRILSSLNDKFERVHDATHGRCWYRIWQ